MLRLGEMATGSGTNDRGRINLSLSNEVVDRLLDLAELEVYGTSKTEVAENLVRDQVARLIATDFFDRARKTRKLSQARRSPRRRG